MAQRGGKTGSRQTGKRGSGARPAKPAGGSGRRGATPARRDTGGSRPGWVWMLIGAGLAVGGYLLIQWHQARDDRPPDPAAEIDPGEPEAEERAEEERERSFDFYELLMQDEVAVPEEEELAESDKRRTEDEEEDEISRAATFEEGHAYLLQAGSFRSHDDAERMRATLALVGLPAQIHTVELDDGAEWHRVRVGPFDDSERLEEAALRMEDNDIQPLMLRQDG